MNEQGSKDNPLIMKMITEPPSIGEMVRLTIFTVAPVAIAILMQKPALRQAITMRLTHGAKEFCQEMADFWQGMALKCGTAYQKARM